MTLRRRLLLGTGFLAILFLGVGIITLRRPPESSVASGRSPKEKVLEAQVDLPTARVVLAKAETLRIQGSLLEAKQLYQQILRDFPESSVVALVWQRLGEVNLKLLFSPVPTPDSVTYVVQSGDTLSKIARQHRTTVELLQAANQMTSDRIRPGQHLKVAQGSFSLVVDKSQNTLTLKQAEEVLKVYRCSTGQGGITPTGQFKVVNRIVDPPWFTPEGVIPSGDPRNILGSRWLGFDQPGYGIHGTTNPSSVGKPVTQGCVRLTNADVEELFTILPEGTPVTIVE